MDIYNSGLWLDLGVRGVWQSQAETLFDIKVISNCTPESVLDSGAQDKKRIYKQAVEDCRGTFTPLLTSIDALLHHGAEYFLREWLCILHTSEV